MSTNLPTERKYLVRRVPRISRGRTTAVVYRDEGDHFVTIIEHTRKATPAELNHAVSEALGER